MVASCKAWPVSDLDVDPKKSPKLLCTYKSIQLHITAAIATTMIYTLITRP
jgi:hypothetical protein